MRICPTARRFLLRCRPRPWGLALASQHRKQTADPRWPKPQDGHHSGSTKGSSNCADYEMNWNYLQLMSSLPVAWYVISIWMYVYYTYGDLFKKNFLCFRIWAGITIEDMQWGILICAEALWVGLIVRVLVTWCQCKSLFLFSWSDGSMSGFLNCDMDTTLS